LDAELLGCQSHYKKRDQKDSNKSNNHLTGQIQITHNFQIQSVPLDGDLLAQRADLESCFQLVGGKN
jgi:hypothetical protein